MSLGVVRPDSDRLPAGSSSIVELALIAHGSSEVAMGRRKIGIDLEGFAKRGNRFVEPPLLFQHGAEIGEVARFCSILPYGEVDQFSGGLISPRLMCNQTQQVEGAGIVGVNGQDSTVAGLSVGQMPGFVMPQALLQKLSHTRFGHVAQRASRCSRRPVKVQAELDLVHLIGGSDGYSAIRQVGAAQVEIIILDLSRPAG
jgi:hypothetical protein